MHLASIVVTTMVEVPKANVASSSGLEDMDVKAK
jgi:hypothetical protein